MNQCLPTRNDLLQKLEHLCAGQECRLDISAWAMAIIADESLVTADRVVWQVLWGLAGVASGSPNGAFLFSAVDFQSWQRELSEGVHSA